MGRPSRTQQLEIWMNGHSVGTWTQTAGGLHQFRYSLSWLSNPQRRPLSLSLPLAGPGRIYQSGKIQTFFSNLLPDSDSLRQRIQERFRTPTQQPFDLLTEIGRDCVGAIQILPPGENPPPPSIQGEPLTAAEICRELKEIQNPHPWGRPDNEAFRFSLAGAQEKTALLYHKGEWMRPLGATPSTHILKLPMGYLGPEGINMTQSLENEWLCSRLLTALGLPTAESRLSQFDGRKVLAVKRFDRKPAADQSWIIRLPQEDLCQALGLPPGRKYESDGGPGIPQTMKLLQGSRQADQDRRTFFKAQIAFWLLAAIDGHGKNFSLFLHPGGRYSLTPLYDVLSAYPVMGNKADQLPPAKVKMAMAVVGKNRHYRWNRIRRDHWQTTGKAAGLARETIEEILHELNISLPQALETVNRQLPAGFPAAAAAAADSILSGVRSKARSLAPPEV